MTQSKNFTAKNFDELESYKKIFHDRSADIIDRKIAAKKIAYIYEKIFCDGGTAVARLKEAVALGDKNSRYTIAEIFRDGRGVEVDGARAIMWFSKILNDKTLPDHERYAVAFEIAMMFHEG